MKCVFCRDESAAVESEAEARYTSGVGHNSYEILRYFVLCRTCGSRGPISESAIEAERLYKGAE